MKGWKTCPVCRGEGVFYDAGDMHKAAGDVALSALAAELVEDGR